MDRHIIRICDKCQEGEHTATQDSSKASRLVYSSQMHLASLVLKQTGTHTGSLLADACKSAALMPKSCLMGKSHLLQSPLTRLLCRAHVAHSACSQFPCGFSLIVLTIPWIQKPGNRMLFSHLRATHPSQRHNLKAAAGSRLRGDNKIILST